MKTFDDGAFCEKCGWHEISSHYCEKDCTRHFSYGNNADKEDAEHIRRRCLRCGYAWNEAVLGDGDENA